MCSCVPGTRVQTVWEGNPFHICDRNLGDASLGTPAVALLKRHIVRHHLCICVDMVPQCIVFVRLLLVWTVHSLYNKGSLHALDHRHDATVLDGLDLITI